MLRCLWQSRTAARKELLDQASSPDECEQLYEESLWCLYALQDEVIKPDNAFAQEDRAVIATCLCSYACVPVWVLTTLRYRDNTHEAPAGAVQGTEGHAPARAYAGRASGSEPRQCPAAPSAVGAQAVTVTQPHRERRG